MIILLMIFVVVIFMMMIPLAFAVFMAMGKARKTAYKILNGEESISKADKIIKTLSVSRAPDDVELVRRLMNRRIQSGGTEVRNVVQGSGGTGGTGGSAEVRNETLEEMNRRSGGTMGGHVSSGGVSSSMEGDTKLNG